METEKTERNPQHQQMYHLIVIVLKKLLMYIKLMGNNRK